MEMALVAGCFLALLSLLCHRAARLISVAVSAPAGSGGFHTHPTCENGGITWPFLSVVRGTRPLKASWLSAFLVCVHLEWIQLQRDRWSTVFLLFSLRLSPRGIGVIIFLNLCVLTMWKTIWSQTGVIDLFYSCSRMTNYYTNSVPRLMICTEMCHHCVLPGMKISPLCALGSVCWNTARTMKKQIGALHELCTSFAKETQVENKMQVRE